MMIDEVFTRKYNGTIDLVRQPTVAASNHHKANNEFAKRVEFPRKGCVVSWIPKTETNIGTSRALANSKKS